jgi:mono/diheme cytochrome c family protein
MMDGKGCPPRLFAEGAGIAMLMRVHLMGMAGAACAETPPDYQKEVKVILREHCVTCHGPMKQKGGLRLDAGALIEKGGKHGAALVAGNSHGSLLIERLLESDEEKRMPQDAKPLPAEKIGLLRRWIDAGAVHPKDEQVAKSPEEHWAFQPVHEPSIPKLQSAN